MLSLALALIIVILNVNYNFPILLTVYSAVPSICIFYCNYIVFSCFIVLNVLHRQWAQVAGITATPQHEALSHILARGFKLV